MANVLVYADCRGGGVARPSLEALGLARELVRVAGGEVHALLVGSPGAESEAGRLARHGAERVLVGISGDGAPISVDVAAGAVTRAMDAGDYNIVVFPGTSHGRDLAPRVGARLGVSVATDVVACWVEAGHVTVKRPVYAGKAVATMKFSAVPALISIRPNVFAPVERAIAEDVVQLDVSDLEERLHVTAVEKGDRERIDVSEARIVVSGGRGMQGPENWPLLEALVDALGDEAALGASRAVVDAGWRPHAEQVGQTGKTVAPDLYFAAGISGAIQHLAGMRTAKVVVALNRDPEAPIFSVADYGVVGDVFTILPALTDAVREARQG